jgi:NADPH-dependent 7-cyano-7-deazaguanine reductase QueF
MKATHTLTVTARCPVNGQRDTYKLEVTTSRVIYVESLLDLTELFVNQRIAQEELTTRIANALRAGHGDDSIEVRTFGTHSGVTTEVAA